MGQLGESLKEARQNKGVSLEKAEEETRIRKKYLQALEEEDFSIIPSEVYVKGFLRNYAIYLGLDTEEIKALYKGKSVEKGKPEWIGRVGQMAREETGPHAFPMDMSMTQSRLLAFPFLVTALAVLAFSLLGLWAFRQYIPLPKTGPETKATTTEVQLRPTFTPTSAITPVPPTLVGTPTPKVYTGVEVELVVLERAWLQVHVDGEKVFEGVFDEGTRITWNGKERVAVRCNNAGGVEVTLNGQKLGPLGKRGQVVDQEWTTQEIGTTPVTGTPAEATPGTPLPTDTPSPTLTSPPPPTDTPVPVVPTVAPETPEAGSPTLEETTPTAAPEG
jgi:transcriptional regulator with XRE-family HTH domain